ncbi:hypothetical protein Anapl_00463 [Anas platyrhynchos]|uniref:Uncharacterized protein n=1 Tax=Anas platyrhynchos TaxID=8839 RepID=R0L5P6_ANAPL|nr:hypothetical protein Anapl_00463 [Anas platyrhynchos]
MPVLKKELGKPALLQQAFHTHTATAYQELYDCTLTSGNYQQWSEPEHKAPQVGPNQHQGERDTKGIGKGMDPRHLSTTASTTMLRATTNCMASARTEEVLIPPPNCCMLLLHKARTLKFMRSEFKVKAHFALNSAGKRH